MVNPDDVDEIVKAKEKEKAEAEAKAEEQVRQKLIAEAMKNAEKGANGGNVQGKETGQPDQAENGQEEEEVKPSGQGEG